MLNTPHPLDKKMSLFFFKGTITSVFSKSLVFLSWSGRSCFPFSFIFQDDRKLSHGSNATVGCAMCSGASVGNGGFMLVLQGLERQCSLPDVSRVASLLWPQSTLVYSVAQKTIRILNFIVCFFLKRGWGVLA